MANDNKHNDTPIHWKLDTTVNWPGDLSRKRDPGDVASVDGGRRSHTTLVTRANWARFTCAHARVTVSVDMGERTLHRESLSRLVLYLAYWGITCACFRARWKYLNGGEKFCRRAAIVFWQKLQNSIGYEKVTPVWEERVEPPFEGEEFSWRGEVVNDGMFPEIFRERRRRR